MFQHSNILFRSLLLLAVCFFDKPGLAQEWQWSVDIHAVVSPETNDHPRAFLWIPPGCYHVRGVVLGQHNMIEEGIFEHPTFRKMLSDLDFAVIWVTPALTVTFDFNNHAGKQFDEMMQSLADVSGYAELQHAPVVPLGHSALASYPWNFAAWNPARTLAAISIHGDAPLTKLTGSGRPNPDWSNRNIEGVPGLFVMGEYEWMEERIKPGFHYVARYPGTPLSFFADAGHGHFDYSDAMIAYISLFIRKAATYRLPAGKYTGKAVSLKPIDPKKGWLMDRWRKDSLPLANAAPYGIYKGSRSQASWVFDEEMARETEKFYARARGKKNQYIGFMQNGHIVKPAGGHAVFTIPFIPLQDGISFRLKAFFADTAKIQPVQNHAITPLVITRICGPVVKINDSTFRLSFYRIGFDNPKRTNDIWLLASNTGDDRYKSAMQQLDMRFPIKNAEGAAQHITFPHIPDQKAGTATLTLKAASSANVPVYYYVQEGPAVIEGDKICFTRIPPHAKYPLKVIVVAWQYGSSIEPKLQTAEPAAQTFYIVK